MASDRRVFLPFLVLMLLKSRNSAFNQAEAAWRSVAKAQLDLEFLAKTS